MISRRSIFAALGLAALVPLKPHQQAEAKALTEPAPPKPPRGLLLPRYKIVSDYSHAHSHSYAHAHSHSYSQAAMVVTEYDIFDGERFVPLNSVDGHRVEMELRGCAQ